MSRPAPERGCTKSQRERCTERSSEEFLRCEISDLAARTKARPDASSSKTRRHSSEVWPLGPAAPLRARRRFTRSVTGASGWNSKRRRVQGLVRLGGLLRCAQLGKSVLRESGARGRRRGLSWLRRAPPALAERPCLSSRCGHMDPFQLARSTVGFSCCSFLPAANGRLIPFSTLVGRRLCLNSAVLRLRPAGCCCLGWSTWTCSCGRSPAGAIA